MKWNAIKASEIKLALFWGRLMWMTCRCLCYATQASGWWIDSRRSFSNLWIHRNFRKCWQSIAFIHADSIRITCQNDAINLIRNAEETYKGFLFGDGHIWNCLIVVSIESKLLLKQLDFQKFHWKDCDFNELISFIQSIPQVSTNRHDKLESRVLD
jgi:hypothetical protein